MKYRRKGLKAKEKQNFKPRSWPKRKPSRVWRRRKRFLDQRKHLSEKGVREVTS